MQQSLILVFHGFAQDTAEAEDITAMPTFKLYKNGNKIDELTGANEAKLREKIVAYKQFRQQTFLKFSLYPLEGILLI